MERGGVSLFPFLQKQYVLWHKPHTVLVQIQTFVLRVVEQSRRNDTGAVGEKAPFKSAAHNVGLVIQLPLIFLSPSLSHAHTKRLIFGLK